MDKTFDYSEIAPFRDLDVRTVLEDLKTHPSFLKVLRFLGVETSKEALDNFFEGIETIEDFQLKITKPWMLRFLKKTTSDITHEGIDSLEAGQKHLFISNHRDIILDSAILNILFSENGIQTVESAIGDNLFKSAAVKMLTKLNKNFTVIRSVGTREMYNNSLTLSSYIRKKITKKESSIWLAQREGRAKDGNDKTQQGLIKMLNLSNKDLFEDGFKNLNIHTVSMSYEYDPCDRFKVKELLVKEAGKTYVKEKEEDLKNLLAGILEYKGHVHLSIQPALTKEIDQLKDFKNINDKTNKLAALIDRSIYHSYKLFENNYAAYDLLHKTNKWQAYYSKEKKQEFEDYINNTCKDQPDRAKEILLEKYAYPLVNKMDVLANP